MELNFLQQALFSIGILFISVNIVSLFYRMMYKISEEDKEYSEKIDKCLDRLTKLKIRRCIKQE